MADVKKTITIDYKDNFNKIANNFNQIGKDINGMIKSFSGFIRDVNKNLKDITLKIETDITKEMKEQYNLKKLSLTYEKEVYGIRLKGLQKSKEISAEVRAEADYIKRMAFEGQNLTKSLLTPGLFNKVSGVSKFATNKWQYDTEERIKATALSRLQGYKNAYLESSAHKRYLFANEFGIDKDPVMVAYDKKISDYEKIVETAKKDFKGGKIPEKSMRGKVAYLTRLRNDRNRVGLAVSKEVTEGEAKAANKFNISASNVDRDATLALAKTTAKAGWIGIAVTAVITVIKKIIDTIKKMGQFVKDTLGVSLSIRDNFMAVVSNIQSAFDLKEGMATFNTSSSLITNARSREMQMRYGLSSSNTYALSRTMGIMGMRNDEDLMYMNRDQVQLFRVFMNQYSSWYQNLQSSGVLKDIQEAQLDIQMLKEEITVDFLKWFAQNKETILNSVKTIAKFVMDLTALIAKITQWILGGAASVTDGNGGTASMAMSDYAMSKSLSGVKVVNINVNQSNNATGVLSDQSHMEQFFGEQMEKISRELALQIG